MPDEAYAYQEAGMIVEWMVPLGLRRLQPLDGRQVPEPKVWQHSSLKSDEISLLNMLLPAYPRPPGIDEI